MCVMPGIVCAIRGGPSSRPTIDRSITLAQETSEVIYFLYVVNLDFLSRTASSRVQAISQEMHQMGEFILLSAQKAAEAAGVKAEGIVRHGKVGPEITNLCHELSATYLVLGLPEARGEENAFNLEMIQQFREEIEEATGTRVIFTQEPAE